MRHIYRSVFHNRSPLPVRAIRKGSVAGGPITCLVPAESPLGGLLSTIVHLYTTDGAASDCLLPIGTGLLQEILGVVQLMVH